MSGASSPFGAYAGIVALIAALGILAAWVWTALGYAPPNTALDAVALLIVGAIFGTGAGAAVVSNGVGRQAEAANTRLDALHVPPAVEASKLIERGVVVKVAPPEEGAEDRTG